MRMKICLVAILVAAVGCMTPAAAQSVKRIQYEKSGIASGVWVGDMFYMSGQLPTPITPADRAKGTPAVYGNTQAQAESTFIKIQNLLKEQGLGMGDVVMMRVYMAADPAMENKLDFAGMNAAYAKFFGTPDQPNKPARSTYRSPRWSRRARSSRSKCRPLAANDGASDESPDSSARLRQPRASLQRWPRASCWSRDRLRRHPSLRPSRRPQAGPPMRSTAPPATCRT